MASTHLVGALIAFGIVTPVAWTAIDQKPPISDVEQVIATPIVAPGNGIRAAISWRWDRTCPIRVETDLRTPDGIERQSPIRDFDPTGLVGKPSVMVIEQRAPEAPAGDVPLGVTVKFYCNPIQYLAPIEKRFEFNVHITEGKG